MPEKYAPFVFYVRFENMTYVKKDLELNFFLRFSKNDPTGWQMTRTRFILNLIIVESEAAVCLRGHQTNTVLMWLNAGGLITINYE